VVANEQGPSIAQKGFFGRHELLQQGRDYYFALIIIAAATLGYWWAINTVLSEEKETAQRCLKYEP
jgi:hypothetical protein